MNNQKGFTLIEMLVVVAIIGLLSSVVVVGVGSARQRARDARRISDIRQIQNLLENAYVGAGAYPANLTGLPAPRDPSTNNAYTYSPATAPAQTYGLGACLEDVRPTGVAHASDAISGNLSNLSAVCTCAATDNKVFCVKS